VSLLPIQTRNFSLLQQHKNYNYTKPEAKKSGTDIGIEYRKYQEKSERYSVPGKSQSVTQYRYSALGKSRAVLNTGIQYHNFFERYQSLEKINVTFALVDFFFLSFFTFTFE
jgi:hypothetical protein